MPDVYLSLGSNLGDRVRNISKAILAMVDSGKMNLKALSSLYETEPIDVTGQTEFINCAAKFSTGLEPESLLELLNSIEREMGRPDESHNEPRIIDIDIMLFDGITLNTTHLIIPHARLKARRFMLEPLIEIDPEITDPVSRKPLKIFLADVKVQKIRRLDDTEEVENARHSIS